MFVGSSGVSSSISMSCASSMSCDSGICVDDVTPTVEERIEGFTARGVVGVEGIGETVDT